MHVPVYIPECGVLMMHVCTCTHVHVHVYKPSGVPDKLHVCIFPAEKS